MKKVNSPVMIGALVFAGVLLFTTCQEDDKEIMYLFIKEGNTISSQGGILSTIDGNVVLTFPEGAIDFTEHFKVSVCQETGECPFLLHPINIEPFVTFKKPVKLSIRYTGCLCNGNQVICQGTLFEMLNWQYPDLMEQIAGEFCNAGLNETTETIDLCISRTGVFAVSPIN